MNGTCELKMTVIQVASGRKESCRYYQSALEKEGIEQSMEPERETTVFKESIQRICFVFLRIGAHSCTLKGKERFLASELSS